MRSKKSGSSGETNLDALLREMQPSLREGIYVFATRRNREDEKEYEPLMTFREEEGETLILELHTAERHGIEYQFPCRMITLNVHSSLDAVGFLARITTRLAELGVGVNPVSAFFHDHLFVPVDRADEVMRALTEMTR